ncbi:MAG: flavodoxin-dependent (E)-4-hydroxy-3-methylbut-2-enyl-diphosphate synthase [Candidatus Eisenbacteria bacterium]|nr:flavodoxin-dependent (E)-4-hydroxy-3-methylbut-2-enyl-diphosphate synthase [Candidatus Eisenbacteria bacterium]
MWKRRKTLKVRIGALEVGGDAPVAVESMTKTDTHDVAATVRQIRTLERAGCELVRVAVPDMAAAKVLGKIASRVSIPVVADVHFDHRLALVALQEGLPGVRLNPGNVRNPRKVEEVVRAAEERRASIRIGVNAGSLPPDLLAQHGPDRLDRAMVKSAMGHIAILESLDFKRIVVSVKSSEIPATVRAYRELSRRVRYPLHVGMTESGTLFSGSIVSAAGIGVVLSEGIGDTVRVSLAASPVREVEVAYRILDAIGVRPAGPRVICCPTCGRCEIDVARVARRVEAELAALQKRLKQQSRRKADRSLTGRKAGILNAPIRIAVMGCGVNGPGEARHADVGIAGGKGEGLLFVKGRVVGKVKERDLVRELMRVITQGLD